MENCNGLLTAAVAERLGVEGHVIKIHTSSRAMEKVGVLDHFPKDVVNRILHLPVTRLLGFEKPWSEREQREGEFKEDKNYIKMWETERKRVQAYDITCAGLERFWTFCGGLDPVVLDVYSLAQTSFGIFLFCPLA